jgi:hypothetical protein
MVKKNTTEKNIILYIAKKPTIAMTEVRAELKKELGKNIKLGIILSSPATHKKYSVSIKLTELKKLSIINNLFLLVCILTISYVFEYS